MGLINRQPISKIIENNTHTHNGFCHNIDFTIRQNGSISPVNFSLGNQGDVCITRLIFDYTALQDCDLIDGDIEEFNHILCVEKDGVITRYTTLFLSEESGKATFIVPATITAVSGQYNFIYLLEEKNVSSGNTNQKEQFVSDTFIGSVTKTDWEDMLLPYLDNASAETDTLNRLSKSNIIIIPSTNHYSISTNNTSLGNKNDKYITRIVFDNTYGDLDEGLDDRYCIFFKDNTLISISKFISVNANSPTMTCWVPAQVTAQKGDINLFIVARTCNKTQRWVSNTLIMNIKDNFLKSAEYQELELANNEIMSVLVATNIYEDYAVMAEEE